MAQEEVAARHRSNLEEFVLRARRVEAHSLAADRDTLRALAAGTLKITLSGNGEARVRQDLPEEEILESAAARIRPLLLEQEACNYLKALTAMTYFQRSSDAVKQLAKAERRAWKARTESSDTRKDGYRIRVCDTATGQTAELDDQELAMAWIYGDVVHHDTSHRQKAGSFGLAERFRAAAPLVAWVMLKAIQMLNCLRKMQSTGALDLDPVVFAGEVVLASTSWEHTVRAYTAPVGTPAPAEALPPDNSDWTVWSRADVPRAAD